ncbi:MAG: hypothetical protein ABIM46_05745 [candidate division WOR-3 bacterium]
MDDPKSKGLLVLVLNVVVPGLGGLTYGSWFCGDKKILRRATTQLSVFGASVILSACNKYLYFMLILAAGVWIWSIADGIDLYRSTAVERPR